jgi:hypothetical protein
MAHGFCVRVRYIEAVSGVCRRQAGRTGEQDEVLPPACIAFCNEAQGLKVRGNNRLALRRLPAEVLF